MHALSNSWFFSSSTSSFVHGGTITSVTSALHLLGSFLEENEGEVICFLFYTIVTLKKIQLNGITNQ